MAATESGGGPPAHSIPSGGTANQVLKKNSSTNYDVSWGTASGGSPLYALVVDSDGTLTTGSGVTITHSSTGTYLLEFDTGISWGAYVASVQVENNGDPASRLGAWNDVNSTQKYVYVTDGSGTLYDKKFMVTIWAAA